ncbi:putative Calcineurin-like metallo-phosphoesterase superfamily protein [Tripterygium wilfordii]|uniref:Putative Calcineurin-like metallo-phosphoesterase superfamily protein n=1 Tax=Tripterygium wilfordii TaxID=458696 RepID=A0A7J7DT95_TRIWF|nr:putative Calcineurin-like metallo-phosphoesterase superfamily protein [Tripterygium wilfordii]
MEKKRSWACTLVTQVSLCFALYLALNLGGSQKPIHQTRVDGSKSIRSPIDIYFITVTGGFRSLEQQTHLLKQMESVAKAYDAKLVVNISELGENNPLLLNVRYLSLFLLGAPLDGIFCARTLDAAADKLFEVSRATSHSHLQKIPWYTTRVSKGQQVGCFADEIKLPHGRSLNLIGVDTGSLQDLIHGESSIDIGNKQLNWLTRRLETTNSNWCMVVGFHPLFSCEDKFQMKSELHNGPLHQVFIKHGVNAYVSGQGCTSYAIQDGVAYIGNPVLRGKDPHLALNGRSDDGREMANGFLLHRVSSLEIETYTVSSAGEIVHKSVVQQRGKEIM